MSDLKRLDSFTLETSKNHLIRNFLRNGRVWVKLTRSVTTNKASTKNRSINFHCQQPKLKFYIVMR